MKDWQVRQELFHRLNPIDGNDNLNEKNIEIEFSKNIVEDAIRYFKEKNIGWIYPSKSYMVAICYAKWLSENFGGSPIEYLNEKDLLYNNDPYFTPYISNKEIYDKILEVVGWNFDESQGMVPDVKSYFLEEFML